ncbi:MAG TPA: filamentous hemagglutinin N-terminal domain-containing protein [Reyranellaceae bacterium]|nr:filamentous hemagglutinin N-terminal domain-containing protein [Reyranellaceae bacterium]
MIRGALPSIGRAAPRPRALALAVSAAFASSVYANPTGPSVTAGGATFSVSGNTLTITNAPGTVINWQQFSIQKDEVTRFLQQHGGSAVLNRVVGGDPSVILGLLQSKLPDGSIGGRVFLINPSGITFGKGAIIDVGGFVASTLKLSDSDFLSGRMMFSGSGAEGAIRVEPASAQEKAGTIRTPEGGHVYLIAPQVENSGVITTPKGEVVIAAGKTVELVNARTPDIRVEYTADGKVTNAGEIVAASGHVGIYGTLIKNSGVVSASRAEVGDGGRIVFKALKDVTLDATSKIEASGAKGGSITIQAETGTLLAQGKIEARGEEGKGGEIQLLAKQVAVHNADVDASGKTGGGTILIGGDFQGRNAAIQNAQRTVVTPLATIRADATGNGDGGKVIVWADGDTRFGGTITARGGPDGGDGGFVEVSGKEQLGFAGMVDTTAPKGSTGQL